MAVATIIACIISTILYCIFRFFTKSVRGRKTVDIEMDNGAGVTVVMVKNDEEAARRAFQETGNALWTNNGEVWSTGKGV